MKIYLIPLVFLYVITSFTMAALPAQAETPNDWEETAPILVGRISHVEGRISRYDPESDTWVSTTREAPFGMDDLLRSDPDTRAEILLPNNTWIRIDGDTRLQLTSLAPELTEVDLPLGNGRLYNKSTRTEIIATTPFGRITAPPDSAFDLYVGETGIDIVAVRNTVFFHHNASRQRHDVSANSAAITADMEAVTAIADVGDPDWSAWNQSMDDLWAERMASRGESATYLPPELHSEAYALDKHGHWERIYYEGRYYRFWRPIQVSASWSPFSWGAWIVWHGDHVWVPHEPFGYVTHHYGNWIFTAGYWYWAPPVTRVMVQVGLPLLHIGFGWYPGRVSWIHSGAHVGWIPLAPYEPYYTHRHWGRRSIASSKWRHHNRHHVFRHHRHAVVIHRTHLYRSDNYRHTRIRDISHTKIRNEFSSVPLLDRKVLKDGRHQRKHDRFYPEKRRHDRNVLTEIRNKRDRRHNARQFAQKERPNRIEDRTRVNRGAQSPGERHSIGKHRSRKDSPPAVQAPEATRQSVKKRWANGVQSAHRKSPSREIEERRHRLNATGGSADNKVRRTEAMRPSNPDTPVTSRGRRYERQQDRTPSPQIRNVPDQRRYDRKPSRMVREGQTQRRLTKVWKGDRSRSSVSGSTKKEIRSRPMPSQVRRQHADRMVRRNFSEERTHGAGYAAAERQVNRSAPARRPGRFDAQMPSERRAPQRTISPQERPSQRDGQGWRSSFGNSHNQRGRTHRTHTGRQRSHRR